ncbi:hypothetical protein BDV95DRAFT_611866 [Massariosphaeria phaeospora]|uniref:Uncharacterized protein n=1 Tax=Massariosphaeria phaeospora TaxID=100035 RepID=A0A7C8I6I4_9PLEO|nr:hypothetical protein BDV95DRAFT_611866 [Massariosphaeria phaeospora]
MSAPQQLIVVRKPMISYEQRRTNKRLQAKTLPKLRQKARRCGLDTHRLTHKWEIVHILAEHAIYGAEELIYEDTYCETRKSFLDLPGEIRNHIYGLMMQPATYVDSRTSAYYDGKLEVRSDCLVRKKDWSLTAMKKLSWTNRIVRLEARSFFFSQNCFQTNGPIFLNNIGKDIRSSLTSLDLDHYILSSDDYDVIVRLLQDCVGLKKLAFCTRLRFLCELDILEINQSLRLTRDGHSVDFPKGCRLTKASLVFRKLQNLKNLRLRCRYWPRLASEDKIVEYPGFWRDLEQYVQGLIADALPTKPAHVKVEVAYRYESFLYTRGLEH